MRPSRETIGTRSLRHGHVIGRQKSPTYSSWRNAKTRCFNRNNRKFKSYGGRGITMCKKWAEDFSAFLKDMGKCPSGMTLERIDVNKGYEPGNCRWATRAEQAKNKRNSLRIVVNGAHVSVKEHAANCGVRYRSVWWHLKQGKTPEQAFAYLSNKARAA